MYSPSNDKLEKIARGGTLISNTKENGPIGTLGIAVTEKEIKQVYNPNGAIYMLSTERILTGNFKGDFGDIISQRATPDVNSPSQKLGVLSRHNKIKFLRKGVSLSDEFLNEADVAIGFAQKFKDSNGKEDYTSFKVSQNMWNDSKVYVDKHYMVYIDPDEEVYTLSKHSGVKKGKIITEDCSTFYKVDDKEVHFKGQFTVDMNINPWDYGALVFYPECSGSLTKPDKTHYALGQIIGKVGDEKSNLVICTPIDTVLQKIDKQVLHLADSIA